jgi:membrane associated rhomboid family serine protease
MSDHPITIVFVLVTALVSWQAFSKTELFERWLFSPYLVKHNKEYQRVFTHALIHANWPHLLFNMIAFYSFGRNLEIVFRNEGVFRSIFPGSIHYWGATAGILIFVVLYVGGIAFATIPAFRKHGNDSNYRAVGASGGVSAVMMASAVLFPTSEIYFFMALPMPAFVWAIVFLFLEDYLSKRGGTNIAHDAHIWGAIFGVAFVALINPKFIPLFFDQVAHKIHEWRT